MTKPFPRPEWSGVSSAHPRAANDNEAPRKPRPPTLRWIDDPSRFFLVLLSIGSVVTVAYAIALIVAAFMKR